MHPDEEFAKKYGIVTSWIEGEMGSGYPCRHPYYTPDSVQKAIEELERKNGDLKIEHGYTYKCWDFPDHKVKIFHTEFCVLMLCLECKDLYHVTWDDVPEYNLIQTFQG